MINLELLIFLQHKLNSPFFRGYDRYGLAIISMFKADIKAEKFRTGEAFWGHVASCCHGTGFDYQELHGLAFDKRNKTYSKVRGV